MKTLTVSQLDIINDIKEVEEKLRLLPPNPIDIVNWPEVAPYKPEASFTIAHNGNSILLQYNVREQEILAQMQNDNDKVCTDSCVEMFISFDEGEHYYNGEFSCIGVALLGYRKLGESAVRGSAEVMASIKRLPSLGSANRGHEKGDQQWSLTLIIPATAFFGDQIKSFDGMRAKANFYKCGDNLSIPHYISWNKINTEKPSFHQPAFFGELVFE